MKVVYMTLEATSEDAMVISQSLADKLSNIKIHATIICKTDQALLNLYDDTIRPFVPDEGEDIPC